MKSRIIATISIMMLIMTFGPQSLMAQDYTFVSFTPKNTDTIQYYDKKDLIKIQNQIYAKRLPAEFIKAEMFKVKVGCSYSIGLFIVAEQFDATELIEITSRIAVNETYKNTLTQNINKKRPADLKNKVIFIDLSKLFVKAFSTKKTDPLLCCPDENTGISLKLCSILKLQDGLYLKLKWSDKTIKKFYLSAIASSDGDIPEIEPRQYVTIYEKKKLNSEAEPIWWLVKKEDPINKNEIDGEQLTYQKFYPKQKYSTIGTNSTLEIRFDQEGLADNIDFFGNISLTAHSGSKKIEVSPYFVIGEEQKAYGVNAIPIKDIAEHFLRLIVEAKHANRYYNKNDAYYDDYPIDKWISDISDKKKANELDSDTTRASKIKSYFKNQLQRCIGIVAKSTQSKDGQLKDSTNFTRRYTYYLSELQEFLNDDSLRMIYYRPESFSKELIFSVLSRRQIAINRQLSPYEIKKYTKLLFLDSEIPDQHHRYDNFILSLKNCFEILDLIKKSGKETTKAFLSFTTLTSLDFKTIHDAMKTGLQEIKGFDKEEDLISQNTDYAKLSEIQAILFQLSRISSNIDESAILLYHLLEAKGYNRDLLKKLSTITDPTDTSNYFPIDDSNYLSVLYDERALKNSPYYIVNNKMDFDEIKEQLAKIAGKELFKRLIFATIDLKSSGIDEGETLQISVVWDRGSTEAADEEENKKSDGAIELVTAKFIVKKVGWHLDITESALLINRINENRAPLENLSPSNFKPTGGASLIWSYHNDHRLPERLKNNSAKMRNYWWLKPLKWLEPSLGLNVSYCDFRTDKDFEVGVGPVLGLWNNKVFLTTGYNLNAQGESPFYMGIGFSFSKVFDTIQKKITPP